MTPETDRIDESHDKPARAARRLTMPMVVAGLLGGHVVFIFVAITIATGDRSFAVVPDYYNKAVDYDHHKAEIAASTKLGWQVQLQPGEAVDTLGQREVVVVMRDASGAPVTGASVSLSSYHFARAGEVQTLALTEILPGQYAAQGRLGREGFWQFDLIATRGDERFITEFKQFVRKPENRP